MCLLGIISLALWHEVGVGVIGITLAMVVDWTIKAMLVYFRYHSGVWLEKKVIK